ncbi:MAG: rhodanese-like domain-containing protein [Phycisphaeraceae bacterium]
MRTLTLLLALLSLAACNPGRHTSDRDLVILDASEIAFLLDEPGRVVLVDVRPREQYEAGHLPGAVHMPLPAMIAEDEQLAEARAIVVYGQGDGSRLAAAGAKKLMRLGYEDVAEFRGGVEAWDGPLVVGDDGSGQP